MVVRPGHLDSRPRSFRAYVERIHASCTASSASVLDPGGGASLEARAREPWSLLFELRCGEPNARRPSSHISLRSSVYLYDRRDRAGVTDPTLRTGDRVMTMTSTLRGQRMKNPALVIPEAMNAIQALIAATKLGGADETTLALVHLRVSQINGCSFCVDLDWTSVKEPRRERRRRRFAVAAWRESPYFNRRRAGGAGARRVRHPPCRPSRSCPRTRSGTRRIDYSPTRPNSRRSLLLDHPTGQRVQPA